MMATVGVLFGTVVLASMPAAHAPTVQTCDDPIVRVVRNAGWTGDDVRIAWAISWRESNHKPRTESMGAAGLFQLQHSVWEGTDIWPDDPYDAQQNADAAHELWTRSGWAPWGITDDGQGINARDYSGWSESQQYQWIWAEYEHGLEMYPC